MCVKIIDYENKKCPNPHNALEDRGPSLITLSRDEKSSTERRDVVQHIACNRHFNEIVYGDARHFASNDLKELQARGLYKNSRDKWEQYYNASLVVPIPEITDEDNNFSEKIVGFLCIDNFNGGLDHDVTLQYATEVAYRLSVMCYRLSEVSRIKLDPIDQDISEPASPVAIKGMVR